MADGRRGGLHARVSKGLGSADGLKTLGFRLNDWVTHGASNGGGSKGGTDPTSADNVEIQVAKYFEHAIGIGKNLGLLYGLALGVGSSAVILAVTFAGLAALR